MNRRVIARLLLVSALCAAGLWGLLSSGSTIRVDKEETRRDDSDGEREPILRGRAETFADDDFLPESELNVLPAGPRVRFRGRVVDPAGAPVAGAVIHLDGPDEVAPIQSNAEGGFDTTLRAGHYRMRVATVNGLALQRSGVFISEPLRDVTTFQVASAPPLRVRILCGEEPLPGTQVLVIPGYEWRVPRAKRAGLAIAKVTTDSTGRAEVEHLAFGPYELQVTYPSGGTQRRRHRHDGPSELLIPLPGLVRVAGQVTAGQDGAGVVEATVRLRTGSGGQLSNFAYETKTGPEGAFELQVPAVPHWLAEVSAPGYLEWRSGFINRDDPEELRRVERVLRDGVQYGKATNLHIWMERRDRALVTGRVVGNDGKGVGDVPLSLRQDFPGNLVKHRVRGDGTFEVSQLPRGSYWAFVRTSDWVTRTPGKFRVPPAGDEPAEIEVAVEPASGLAGRVVDAEIRGVAGARVWVTSGWSRHSVPGHASRVGEVITDASGRWSIRGLYAHKGMYVYAARGILRAPPVNWTPVAKGSQDIVLELRPAVALHAVVREYGSGEGVPFARVRIQPPMKPSGFPERQRTPLHYDCDAEGRFESEAMLPELWHIRTGSIGHLPQDYQRLDLRGKKGVFHQEFWLDPGLAIGGRVSDAGGSPLLAIVTVRGRAPRAEGDQRAVEVNRTAQTSDAGKFLISGLRPGTYKISVASPGFASQYVQGLVGGEDALDIVLGPRK